MTFHECDNCGKPMPCVEGPIMAPGTGETYQCHVCRQLPDCDECESYGRPLVPKACDQCGGVYDATDLVVVETCPASRFSPAEYERWCAKCSTYPEDDGDAALDAIRNGD